MEALVNGHAVSRRDESANFKRAAILEQSKRDRIGAVPMAHGGNVELHTGFVQGHIRHGRAEDLAVARDRFGADADRKYRRRGFHLPTR